MMPRFRFCSYVCLLLTAFSVLPMFTAFASIFGTVRGIVHDVQHHPISGAHLSLQAKQSDWKRDAVTDDEGKFQFDAVPAGDYTIRVSHDAFRELVANLSVIADSAPLRHFPLELAGVTEKVEVNESSQSVDTTSSASQTTLSRETISDTPGASRANSLDLITDYTPGAYLVHDQLHVRGGHQVSWLVDGIPVPNTNIASNVGPQFDPKDMDVVEIQRGGYAADYGDRTYGVFNVIPRSGFERDREIELLATYGNYHQTDSQLSIGDHTERFAYYASVSANRTDVGLMTPEPNALHDNNNGVSGFTSLIFNATPNDQLRLAGSARADFFQVPNTTEQQGAEIRDTQRERDGFLNFSWVHTFHQGVLFTVSPFVHWNHAAYDGSSPIPSLQADQPPIPTDHNNSIYEGSQVSLAVTRGRHNARFGVYGFAQQDDSFFRVVATDGSGCHCLGNRFSKGRAVQPFRGRSIPSHRLAHLQRRRSLHSFLRRPRGRQDRSAHRRGVAHSETRLGGSRFLRALLPGPSADHGLWPVAAIRRGSGCFFSAATRRNRRATRIRHHHSSSRLDTGLLEFPDPRAELLRSRCARQFQYFFPAFD